MNQIEETKIYLNLKKNLESVILDFQKFDVQDPSKTLQEPDIFMRLVHIYLSANKNLDKLKETYFKKYKMNLDEMKVNRHRYVMFGREFYKTILWHNDRICEEQED